MRRMPPQTGFWFSTLAGLTCFAAMASVVRAQQVTAELALSFRPVQADVEYEQVDKSQVNQCKVQVERQGKISGWAVFGPDGQTLRRFWDTNGDSVVDQWRYYDRGYEVYRDIDSNFNNKVDQSRWLHTSGTRWGIDTNEDGRLDGWKFLSAEEASREAILAMATGDLPRLQRVLVSADDVKSLGLNDELSKQMLANLASPAEKVRARLSQSRVIRPTTTWMRFDNSMAIPYVIPADAGKANRDLYVYENVMAIVENGAETGFVQVGEMLQVGDVWKLTQIPVPVEGETLQITEGGVLMQPVAEAIPGAMAQSDISPEMRKLLTDLQTLDENAPTPASTAAELATYNRKRVEILQGLLAASQTEEERTQWLTQMIDGIAAAVQTGRFPEGAQQLARMEADLRKQRPNSDLIPYTEYRKLVADYTVKLQSAEADTKQREELQTWWLQQLQAFVAKYPKSDDAAAGLLQLAITEEFSGNVDAAQKWYTELAGAHADTEAGQRARGALQRFNLKGNRATIKGTTLQGQPLDLASYRGKAVLVIFWASWCGPCTEDLPQIKALYEQYRAKGFEIVGVNLDTQSDQITPYITEHGNRWPHIQQPQGLEDEISLAYGIVSVPTMFLINQQGVVVNNAASVEDLKEELPKLLP